MRVALVVGSAYEKNAKLTAIPSAELDTDRMAQRLSAPDAGFKVLRFEAERGLAERIEQRLLAQVEPVDELLVYFSGYSVLSEERGPALLLDGDRLGTFSLKRLKNLFLNFAPNACLVVDTAAVVDGDQRLDAVAEAIGHALTEGESGIQVLVSVRNSETRDVPGGSSFTDRLLKGLDSVARRRDASQPLDLRSWCEAVRRDGILEDLPASGWFGDEEATFAILTAQSARSFGALPSFADSSDSVGRPPSSEDLTPPKHTLPSFQSMPTALGVSSLEADEHTPVRAMTLPSYEDGAPSDGSLPRFDDITNPETSLPRFDDITSPESLPRFDDTTSPHSASPAFEEPSSENALPHFDDVTANERGLPRFDDVIPSEGALPRFDDTTSPQLVLPRFEDVGPTSAALPQFEDAPQTTDALPRFEDAPQTTDALPRFEDSLDPAGALPSFDDAPQTVDALPRFEDAPQTDAALRPLEPAPLPRFEDAPPPMHPLPRFTDGEVSRQRPLEPARLIAASGPLPHIEVPIRSSSSKPLPRFEIPDGAASDLDALLGLSQASHSVDEARVEAPPPPVQDPEPTTQPGGGSPFEPEDVTGTTRADSLPGAVPPLTPSAEPEVQVSAADLEAMVTRYEAALELPNAPGERTRLLAELSRALAKLGRTEEAAQRFAAASELGPTHPDVLCVRAEWAEAALDFDNLLHTVQAWLAVFPGDPRPLRFFARAAEALGDAPKALEAWSSLGHSQEWSRRARAEALSNACRIAETKLDNRGLAEDLAAETLMLAPDEPAFRNRAAELFSKGSEPERLFAYFDGALDQVNDAATLSKLLEAIETSARAMGQPQFAARSLERLATKHPADLWLRDRLTELYAAAARPHEALAHCRAAARLMPTRPGTYRRAQALFHAAGAIDGAWNAASVLECLGEADINEALFASQHRPEGLLAARNTIAEAQWPSGLLSEVRDPELEALLAALDAAAVRAGIALLKHKRRYIELDPATKEDPERSTTMLAKTLGWTSRLLGIAPPSLYILPELASNLDIAPSEEPGALVSRALGSGLGLGELAFLWGRHLTRFRSELRALSFFRDPDELSSMLRAALALGGVPDFDARTFEGDAKRLYGSLRRDVQGSALERLQRAARRFPAREIEERVGAALRGLELAGVRAGLLACGDVAAAADLLQRFPETGLTDTDEQLGELYAFSISEPYEGLRLRIGVAVAA